MNRIYRPNVGSLSSNGIPGELGMKGQTRRAEKDQCTHGLHIGSSKISFSRVKMQSYLGTCQLFSGQSPALSKVVAEIKTAPQGPENKLRSLTIKFHVTSSHPIARSIYMLPKGNRQFIYKKAQLTTP